MLNMFKYNWYYLYKYCKGDCNLMLKVLRFFIGEELRDKKAYHIAIKLAKKERTSFIKDIHGLLADKASNQDKCIFLFLASKRNVAEYTLTGNDWLHKALISFDINKLKHNTLIEIKSDYIIFKY